ncbi:MAG: heme-binding protein [Chloroflexi bacterium]|nr:heme-binding protein [Chloroflexota bacterium]
MANLTLAEAETVLAGAKAKVVELGLKMSISVIDPRGDLITMFRMDGAPWRTPSVSRGKAVAAASFETASGNLTDNSQAPIFRAFMAMEGGHMIPGQGALPIFRNGEIIGAVGGSGGTAQEDEDCCRAGIVAAGFSETK